MPDALFVLAATDPAGLQDVIVAGSVAGAVGAALFSGLRKEPTPCDLCKGTGGCTCFGCNGAGKMDAKASRDDMYKENVKRDMFGRTLNPRLCRVCKGTGIVLCSQCGGNGYVSKLL